MEIKPPRSRSLAPDGYWQAVSAAVRAGPAGSFLASARHCFLAALTALVTAVETPCSAAVDTLFAAFPAAEHASSAALRAFESEIDLAASLHLETALFEFELLLPQPPASRPQTTSTSTDPVTRPMPSSSGRGRREPTRLPDRKSSLG